MSQAEFLSHGTRRLNCLGEKVQPEFSLRCLTTVITALSKGLTGTSCREGGLSMSQEAAGLCRACRGAGFIAGLLEHSSFESGFWCPRCEAGRLLAERIAEIIAREREEERPPRNASDLEAPFRQERARLAARADTHDVRNRATFPLSFSTNSDS